MMKKVLSAVLVAVLVGPPAVGQKTAPELKKRDKTPTGDTIDDSYRIRTYTKLVQVPVIVTKGGEHVRGLKKDDFSILEEGVPRAIATFEEVIPSAERFVPPVQKPGEYTNAPQGVAPAPRSITIIALDVANSPFMNQQQGRAQLIKYLEEKIERGSLFSLVAFSRGRLVTIHELTSDPRVLVAALKGMKSSSTFTLSDGGPGAESPMPIMLATPVLSADAASNALALARVETNRLDALAENQDPMFGDLREAVIADGVFEALNSLAKSYGGIPGRKSLFWVSSWFPSWMSSRNAVSSTDWSGGYLKTMEALNDANIAVYPVDSRGLIAPSGFSTGFERMTMAQVKNPFGHQVGMRRDMSIVSGGKSAFEQSLNAVLMNRPEESAKDIAELTGGRAFYGTNDLVGAFRKADADAQHYYMLGYYLPANEAVKPGRKTLRVVVNRAGVKVRGRNRMFIAPAGQRMDDVKAAILSPLEFTTLPVEVKFDPTQGGEKADFTVTVQGRDVELEETRNKVALDFVVITRDPSGTTVDLLGKTLDGTVDNAGRFHQIPINLRDKIKLPDKGGTARFIVRDQVSGKIGSVIVELAAAPKP